MEILIVWIKPYDLPWNGKPLVLNEGQDPGPPDIPIRFVREHGNGKILLKRISREEAAKGKA